MWVNNNKNAAAQAAQVRFFNDPQGIHAQIVSCHISLILSWLSKKYLTFGDQNSAAMKDARQSVYIKAFKEFIQSNERLTNNPELVEAISYIETVMAELPNWQDNVTFWEKSDERDASPKQVSLTISVKETLSVVCAALMDEKAYRYESDSEREKARADRVETLCDCLIDLSKNRATHEAARHKLAFCLNYTYPEIKFIMVDFDFIWPHVRRTIVKKLLLESRWQDHFKAVVWPWIKEGEMPEAAWDLLNSSNPVASSSSSSVLFVDEIKTSLAEIFLSYGMLLTGRSTDSAKAISKHIGRAIDDCCNRIRDMDFPAIANPTVTKLHEFMKTLSEAKRKKKEIIVLMRWLESSFDPSDSKHIVRLNKFFEIYEILEKIARYDYALKTNESYSLLLSTIKPLIEKYFDSNLAMPDDALRAKITAFNKAYSGFIESKKVKFIEDFFELYFKNKAVEHNNLRADLFYKLCNPDYQENVKISDCEIIDKCGALDLNGAIEIDVYFLNRCLLHALTVPVAEWSEVFYNALQQLYQFILNDFNTAGMRGISCQLKESSYPKTLLLQIKYLLECYGLKPNKPRIKPMAAVLTPTIIETGEEAFQGLCYVAMASNQNDFIWLPEAIKALKNKVKIFSIHRLVQVLRKCPNDAVRLQFLKEFINIMSDTSNVSLIDLVDCFVMDDMRMYVLESITARMHNMVGDEVTAILCIFTEDESRLRAFAILIDRLNRHTLSATELINVLFEFKSVVSAKEPASSLENQIEVFRNLLLINEFQPPAVNKKIKFDQIFDAAQLSQRYVARSSALVTFPANNRLYLNEIIILGELTRSKSKIAFEKVVERLAELLILGKKEINFDDDLFIMLHSIRKSMQTDVAANDVAVRLHR